MGTHPTTDAIRILMRAAAEHGEVTSPGFVSTLTSVLARQAGFDAAGLVLVDTEGVARAHLTARDASWPLSIEWNAPVAQADGAPLQDCPVPVRIEATSEAGPLGALLSEAGLGAAAMASIGAQRRGNARLCVAARDSASLVVDLQWLGELAQALGTMRALLGSPHGCMELEGLEQLDYFAAVGRLAGGLVHEVNNPATFIALAAGQLEKSLSRSEHAAELDAQIALCRDIAESVRQMRSVVSDFHVVSTVARHAVSGSIDLTRMLRASANLTAVAYRTTARLDIEIDELPSCPSSFMALVPVVVHLILNAIQSIPPGKGGSSAITLRAGGNEQLLVLSVRDTGCGMDKATLARACDPFFTTRPAGQGAGVGLTLAREAVSRLGGSLALESEPGAGTTVRVEVPLPPG